MRILVPVLAAVLVLGSTAHAQFSMSPRNEFPVPDGPVAAMIERDGMLYLGGQFKRLGLNQGAGLLLNGTTGALYPSFPLVDGAVYSVAPDSAGGFYIGGNFATVGGVGRSRLAHIRADKTVDPIFNPIANAPVFSLYFSGDILYAGGDFTNIGRQNRNRVAALATATGNATLWNPNPSGPVRALTVAGSRIYVGGLFTNIGGLLRTNLAMVDAIEGAASPGFNPAPSGPISVLAISGTTLYIGGTFTNVAGVARSNIASIQSFSGVPYDWNPAADGPVSAIALSGGSVYVGGAFSRIGGTTRENFAAVDASTGAATLWNPAPGGPINALALAPGGIFMGGAFTNVGATGATNIALVDTSTGSVTPAPVTTDEVIAIGASSDNALAGTLSPFVNSVARNGLAAIDVQSASIAPWNPQLSNLNGPTLVSALALADDTIYAGGVFASAGEKPRTNIVALDRSTGAAKDWSPASSTSGEVAALAVSSNALFIGGSFTNISEVARTNLAAVDRISGALLDWNPAPNGRVNALTADDRNLFVGGSFTTITGENRRRIASFDLSTTNLPLDSWQPEAIGNASSAVLAIAVPSAGDDRVYVGGLFASIGGEFRTNLAAISRRTGAAIDTGTGSSVDWRTPANNAVWSLALAGTNLYMGGDFSTVGNQLRTSLALLDSFSGALTAWNPGPNGRVLSIVPTASGVLVSGQFTGFTVAGVFQYRPNLAFFGPAGFSSLAAFLDSGNFLLQISGNVDELYQLDRSTNMVDWNPIGTNRLSAPSVILQNPGGTNPVAFFRVKALGQ